MIQSQYCYKVACSIIYRLYLDYNPGWKVNLDYYVYIMASRKNGAIYIGVTSDLLRRVYEHRNEMVDGFTKRYKVRRLVYYEHTNDVYSAIEREKALKKWNRQWKIELIEKVNPDWKDLYNELI